MKRDKLYNINPVLNKWEEDNYARLMARKIKGARSAITGAPASLESKGSNRSSRGTIRSSSSYSTNTTTASQQLINSSQYVMGSNAVPQTDIIGNATEVLTKLQELLQLPLLQQIQQLQLPPASTAVSAQRPNEQPTLVASTVLKAGVGEKQTAATAIVACGGGGDTPVTASSDPPHQGNVCSSGLPLATSILSGPAKGGSQPAALSLASILQAAQTATLLLKGADSHQTVVPASASRLSTGNRRMAASSVTRSRTTSGVQGRREALQAARHSRGSSMGGSSSKQKPRPAWNDHWFAKEPPSSTSGAEAKDSSSTVQSKQKHQQQGSKMARQVMSPTAKMSGTTCRAVRCESAAVTGHQQHQQHWQKPSVLNKQSSMPVSPSRTEPASAVVTNDTETTGKIPCDKPGSAVDCIPVPSSKHAAQAALARLRQGSAAAGAGSLRTPLIGAIEAQQEFRVRLLPVKTPGTLSTAQDSPCKQTCHTIFDTTIVDKLSASGSVGSSRQSCSQGTVGMSYNTCSSPSRYSNTEEAEYEDEVEQTSGVDVPMMADPQVLDRQGDMDWAGAATADKDLARRQAATPVDMLTASLMTLNNIVRSKVQDLISQQEQHQHQQCNSLPEQTCAMQETDHITKQGYMGLCADASLSELLGVGVQLQPSELLVVAEGAAALGLSDLAFLEQASMGQQLPDAAAVVPRIDEERFMQSCYCLQQHRLQNRVQQGTCTKTAAAAAEEGDDVLLGTLPSSSTGAVAAAGGASVPQCPGSLDAFHAQQQCCQNLLHDDDQHNSVQPQQLDGEVMQPVDDLMYAPVSTTTGADGVFQVCEYTVDSDSESDAGRSDVEHCPGSAENVPDHHVEGSNGEDDYMRDWEDDEEPAWVGNYSTQHPTGAPDVLQVTYQQYTPARNSIEQQGPEFELMEGGFEDSDCGYLSGLEQSASGELHHQTQQLMEGLQQLQLLVGNSTTQS